MMVDAFSESDIILGSLIAISTFIWIALSVYNVAFMFHARREFSALGGAKAATKDFARQGAQAAYDNREVVKEVIVENKDTIKRVAVENKDTIIDFARENRETVARVAVDNKDTIWENRDIVASVFDDSSQD